MPSPSERLVAAALAQKAVEKGKRAKKACTDEEFEWQHHVATLTKKSDEPDALLSTIDDDDLGEVSSELVSTDGPSASDSEKFLNPDDAVEFAHAMDGVMDGLTRVTVTPYSITTGNQHYTFGNASHYSAVWSRSTNADELSQSTPPKRPRHYRLVECSPSAVTAPSTPAKESSGVH